MIKIPFDTIKQEFDTQYPILLAERGIDVAMFQSTVQRLNLKVQESLKPIQKTVRLWKLVTVLAFILMIAVAAPFAIAAIVTGIFYLIIPIPLVFVATMVTVFIVFLKISRLVQTNNETLRDALQSDVFSENKQKYLSRGVQFLLRFEVRLVGRRRRVEVPYLEILISPSVPAAQVSSAVRSVPLTEHAPDLASPYYPSNFEPSPTVYVPAAFTEPVREDSVIEPMIQTPSTEYVNFTPIQLTSAQFHTKQ